MATNYYTKQLVKTEHQNDLWEAYNQCPEEDVHQDWNLWYLKKRQMKQSYWKQWKSIHDIDRYMFRKYNARTHVHYFLKYIPDSYTRVHQDNKNTVTKTVITLLEESPDLVGGDTLVFDRHYQKPMVEGAIFKGKNADDLDLVPVAVKNDQYQSLIYDWNVQHGVTRVFSGHRIVLVSWYVSGQDLKINKYKH